MFQSGSSSQPGGNEALEAGFVEPAALSAACSAEAAEVGNGVTGEACGVCLAACFKSSKSEHVELN